MAGSAPRAKRSCGLLRLSLELQCDCCPSRGSGGDIMGSLGGPGPLWQPEPQSDKQQDASADSGRRQVHGLDVETGAVRNVASKLHSFVSVLHENLHRVLLTHRYKCQHVCGASGASHFNQLSDEHAAAQTPCGPGSDGVTSGFGSGVKVGVATESDSIPEASVTC